MKQIEEGFKSSFDGKQPFSRQHNKRARENNYRGLLKGRLRAAIKSMISLDSVTHP
jgi:hypothetical protein